MFTLSRIRQRHGTKRVFTWDRGKLRPLGICNFCSCLHGTKCFVDYMRPVRTQKQEILGAILQGIIITFTSRSLNIFFTNRPTFYVNRKPWSFKLPSEKYKIYITLIWWPVNIYRTVSQNGAILHINPSIYSIQTTSKFTGVIDSGLPF